MRFKRAGWKSAKGYLASLCCVGLLSVSGCGRHKPSAGPGRVVMYCSVDDVYAKPVLRHLEQVTGIGIDPLYDTEAAKTAGLANRIRAEGNRPRADIFWSSVVLQTLLLAREGLIAPYPSPAARNIPDAFKDKSGIWTGLGVRARVIVYHRGLKNPPRTLEDLLKPQWKNQVGISNPQFGTSSDWVAALATRWGAARTVAFFRALKQHGVQTLPGNSVVAEKVARGELPVGITDDDDYLQQLRRSGTIAAAPVENPTINGMLMIGSVALLKQAPHPQAARRMIDALIDDSTEKLFVAEMPGVLPVRGLSAPAAWQSQGIPLGFLRQRGPDDIARWPAGWDAVRDPLAEILLRD